MGAGRWGVTFLITLFLLATVFGKFTISLDLSSNWSEKWKMGKLRKISLKIVLHENRAIIERQIIFALVLVHHKKTISPKF